MARNKKEIGLGAYKGEEKSFRLLQMVFRLFAEKVITEAKAATLAGLSASAFRALYYNIPREEIFSQHETANSSFAKAWAEDEPEYGDEDLLTINPDYEGR